MTPQTIEGPTTERAKSLQSEEDVSRTFSLQRLAQNLRGLQLAHLGEELAVGLGFGKTLDQQLHGFHGRERIQDFAQHPNPGEIIFRDEELFFTRAGSLNINRREGTLVDELAVEDDFRIAGAFEFFKDHIVHARASVDEGSRDNGQGSAFFDVSCRAEETLGAL